MTWACITKAFARIWKPACLKAKSFTEFADIVRRENAKEVTGSFDRLEPSGNLFGGETSAAIGNVGTFTYFGIYRARLPNNRLAEYREDFGKDGRAFGSTRGFGDASNRDLMSLRSLITVYEGLQLLHKTIPGLEVRMQDFGPQHYQQMLKDAAGKNLAPFPTKRGAA